MNRINLHSLYELGHKIHEITTLNGEKNWGGIFLVVGNARAALSSLLEGHPVALRNPQPIQELLNVLTNAAPKMGKIKNESGEEVDDISAWWSATLSEFEVNRLSVATSNLEIVIANEFPLYHSYLLSEDGLESVDTLIQSPEITFTKEVTDRLKRFRGNPLDDFSESARCLAFGFSTACGFHVVRAAEAVLRKWISVVKEDADFDTAWATCVQDLEAHYNSKDTNQEVKKRVLGLLKMLDSLRDANRNPLMHPEMSLDAEQATSIFRLVTSLITAMVREIIQIEDSR